MNILGFGKKEPEKDLAKERYYELKRILKHIDGYWDRLNTKQQKYYAESKEYISRYEKNQISSLWDFYKRYES